MVVFAATRLGATPEIYALATVIVLVVAALLPGAALVQRWSRRSA
jgi:ABC-type spermidine/putrescine transport system permease subunit II